MNRETYKDNAIEEENEELEHIATKTEIHLIVLLLCNCLSPH